MVDRSANDRRDPQDVAGRTPRAARPAAAAPGAVTPAARPPPTQRSPATPPQRTGCPRSAGRSARARPRWAPCPRSPRAARPPPSVRAAPAPRAQRARSLQLGHERLQRMTRNELIGSIRRHNREPIAPDVAHQERQQVARGRIDPVDILDDQQHRLIVRQPGEHTIHRLEQLLLPACPHPHPGRRPATAPPTLSAWASPAPAAPPHPRSRHGAPR